MSKRVLVFLRMSSVAGQEKLAGILKSLGREHDWDLRLVRTQEDFTRARLAHEMARKVDGLIVGTHGKDDVTPLLRETSVPTVCIDLFQRELAARQKNLSFVAHSDVEIGREAARQLIAQGRARSYAFVHFHGCPWYSVDRLKGFREALREAGLWCECFGQDDDSPEGLTSFLRKLPKPAAILAANDDCGFEILEICRRLHLRVPRQVFVLGVDNDRLICEHALPPLSSVHPDNERAGALAAQELDRLMRESASSPRTITVGIRQIVQRASTADESRAGHLVQRAVAFINGHATLGISVDDVVHHLKVSRRLVELRFRQLQQRSIGEAIAERKFEELKHRLLHTHQTIEEATRASGFANINSAKNLFRRQMGTTMSAWRQQHALLSS